jgi:hypothetical protein
VDNDDDADDNEFNKRIGNDNDSDTLQGICFYAFF